MSDKTTTPKATARVTLVSTPDAYPGSPDAETKKDVAALFKHMFPHAEAPEIPGSSAVFAVIAQNPKLSLLLVKVSDYILGEMPFTHGRADLRECAVQALCYHFKCDFNFTAHLGGAKRAGITVEQQAHIPFWKTTNVFTEEQRLVIEYTYAVVAGDVPEELFARVVQQFGEKIAIECTVAIAWWSFWCMIANATRPQFDFGYGPPST